MNLMDSVSIGVDIVDIGRISKNIDDINDRFINRVYTNDEINYCKNKKNISLHFAGRLAGKEAVSKALEMSWEGGVNWKDIEILSEENGIPRVVLYGEAKKVANKRKIRNIKISISHEKEYAIAFAIMIGGTGNE